jgi:hypothetical protein
MPVAEAEGAIPEAEAEAIPVVVGIKEDGRETAGALGTTSGRGFALLVALVEV